MRPNLHMKKAGSIVGVLAVCFCCMSSWGTLPDSRYQYAADGEYSDLLILPWKSHKVGSPTIEFKCPQCFEEQKAAARYTDAMLFNGVVKFAGESVVAGFSLAAFDCTDEMKIEVQRLMAASESELASPSFVKSIASLAGRKDIVETGAEKVGGKNAFWCTTRMVRRVGNQVVYCGLQRIYLIPVKNGKKLVTANFVVGALGVDEIPYADFKAFQPIAEKIVKNLKINESKWNLW